MATTTTTTTTTTKTPPNPTLQHSGFRPGAKDCPHKGCWRRTCDSLQHVPLAMHACSCFNKTYPIIKRSDHSGHDGTEFLSNRVRRQSACPTFIMTQRHYVSTSGTRYRCADNRTKVNTFVTPAWYHWGHVGRYFGPYLICGFPRGRRTLLAYCQQCIVASMCDCSMRNDFILSLLLSLSCSYR